MDKAKDTNQTDFLQSLSRLIAINSTADIGTSEERPYGDGPAEALDYVLALCQAFGMRTVNRGGKVGYAEFGEGSEIVGILAHLDVVPAGSGWDYSPFALTEKNGKLYGRGVTDDKGPLMACIYAMRDILKQNEKLNRRVRIIFGQTEETGDWKDIEYYCANEEMPVFGFTPDADFPAIYGEKGICNYVLTMPLSESGFLQAEGGNAANMVPDFCKVVLKDGTAHTANGKSAHASLLEDGDNAISKLMSQLEKAGTDSRFVAFYQKHIGKSLHGEMVPCAFSDEQSGALTMNAGVLQSDEENLSLTLDVRFPVTLSASDIDAPLKAAAAPFGIEVSRTFTSAPVYMDKNGEVLQKLLTVYRKATGDNSEPMVIGGGTYARSMPNIIAFGPMLPGRELTEHQKNEYILKEDLFLLREIYKEAILALANV